MANRAISSITVDQGQKGAGVTGQEEMHNHPTLYIVSGATMLVLIILTVPLTTIGLTAASLGAGVGAKAWFLSAMPLGAASGLLGAGTLGDNCGRRSVFLWGLVVMAIASVAAAFSTSSLLFIFARIVQGLGGAAVLACGLGLLGQVFPDQQSQSKATALWAAGLGAGVACGPIFAGVVGELAGWSAVYWGVGLLSACLLGLGYFALPATDPSEGRPLDWVGMLLFMMSLAMVMSGLTELRFGWSRVSTLVLLGGGLGLLGLFLSLESRHRAPMLELSLFKSAGFTGATVGAFASGAGILALMTLLPMFLSRVMGLSAIHAAFVLCMWSVTSVVTAFAVRWLPEQVSLRSLLIGGLMICAVAQLMLLLPASQSSFVRFLPGLFIAGAANGILNAALGRQAIATVPASYAALGSGANNTARYLGSAMGITLGAVMLAHGSQLDGLSGLLNAWNEVVVITAGVSFLGALVITVVKE